MSRRVYKAVLEPRVSPDFAITYFCNHCNIRFENTDQSMWIHWPFFPKTWTKGHWPLDDLWPHVWLYPRITVSKSHDNTSMYVDTVINFAKYHIHTHTMYRMSDHIVSYWTQFRRDNYWTQFRQDNYWTQFRRDKNIAALKW